MSISDRKEREKERRRRDILDTAEILFFQKGFENVTMADIANEIELARSTLYLYFKNKEEIYLAIAIRGSKILRKMFMECYERGATGLEKVRMLTLAFSRFCMEYPGYYDANWFSHSVRFDEEFPEIEEIKEIRTQNFKLVGEAFKEGIKDGTIRPDADPVKTTLVLTSSMQNVLNLTPAVELHMKNNNLTHEELIDYAVDMMMRSFESKQEKK
ncbi:TetR/AcrR family transcriptional regulator [Methanobacterium sp. ACI-7]|uniref:TetR/AcrR family transcriptional regulator n=1 Tax=unclassified Methanobacterium TaxID=2627676 RepID=UPI0039C4B103